MLALLLLLLCWCSPTICMQNHTVTSTTNDTTDLTKTIIENVLLLINNGNIAQKNLQECRKERDIVLTTIVAQLSDKVSPDKMQDFIHLSKALLNRLDHLHFLMETTRHPTSLIDTGKFQSDKEFCNKIEMMNEKTMGQTHKKIKEFESDSAEIESLLLNLIDSGDITSCSNSLQMFLSRKKNQ